MNSTPKNTIRKGDLQKEHGELMKGAPRDVVLVNTEWSQSGDYFKQLTTYDFSYVPVETFGGTTMIAPS
ncbi:MAG: hypothetical protein LBT94_01495 [Prevotellaceae bacterium]|jgi:hypothetical protein|nr:hypothetical protein [Prevotellaceae bacterium]